MTKKQYEIVRLTEDQMGKGQGGFYVRSMAYDETFRMWRLGSYSGPLTREAAEKEAAERRAQ